MTRQQQRKYMARLSPCDYQRWLLVLAHPCVTKFRKRLQPIVISACLLIFIPLAFYSSEGGRTDNPSAAGTLSNVSRGQTESSSAKEPGSSDDHGTAGGEASLVAASIGAIGSSAGTHNYFRDIVIGWDSLLHMRVWSIAVVTSVVAFFLAHRCERAAAAARCRDLSGGGSCYRGGSKSTSSDESCCCKPNTKQGGLLSLLRSRWPLGGVWTCVWALSLAFSLSATVQSQLQIIYPSWMWNPFMWGTYQVYKPSDLIDPLEDLCVDYALKSWATDTRSGEDDLVPSRLGGPLSQVPLCLSESSWKILSTEALSSRNADDVDAVLRGVSFAQQSDHGLVINVMSRDTIDSIGPLRQNVEGLAPFFPKLAVVVFENDSKDGSRQAFQKWGQQAEGYTVDVMECPEAEGCVFGESHRYDSTEATEYFRSSAIGRMAEFRQRIVDYVLGSPDYADYSHMMVVDLDLGVSFSPLGVLHTLGKAPHSAVVSSGRQAWPGSFGALVPPYDFSAFRAVETPRNKRLLDLHKMFCGLSPPGDRWRNQCDAVSPMHMMLILGRDRSGPDLYEVESAFNGAALYPLDLVRESGAKYDVGDDGQRCEHIGFNLSLKKPLYVNPKWNMHVDPSNPGGPTGGRAVKNIFRIVFTPRLSMPIFLSNLSSTVVFIYCILTLVMYLLYPFWVKILSGTKFREIAVPCADVGRRGNHKGVVASGGGGKGGDATLAEWDGLMQLTSLASPRKRKISDCEAWPEVV